MGFWSKFGKIASIAAPIVAAPFTGGASLALIGAGAGVGGAMLDPKTRNLKGAITGGALGAIPGLSGAGKAAGAVAPSLTQGLKQAGTSAAKGLAKQYGGQAAASLLSGGGGGGGQGGNVYSNFVSGGAPKVGDWSNPGFGGGAGGGEDGGWWGTYGPLITQVGGAAAGALAGRQATKMAAQRSPEEQAALRGMTGVAGQASRLGNFFATQGQQYLQQPANYFSTLLSGNRAAMNNAVAPAVAQITGNYRGATRALEHSGMRGAARDVATADLNRQRASQVAGLTTGVQPYAAEQLAGLGQNMMGLAPGMMGTAGTLYGGMLGAGFRNREYSRDEGEKTSKAIGGLVRDVGETVFKGGKKGGTGGATTPPGTSPAPPGFETVTYPQAPSAPNAPTQPPAFPLPRYGGSTAPDAQPTPSGGIYFPGAPGSYSNGRGQLQVEPSWWRS